MIRTDTYPGAFATGMALLLTVLAAFADTTATVEDEVERRNALALYNAGRHVEAAPLLEKVATIFQKDPVVREAWAFSLAVAAQAIEDPLQQKATRARARRIAVEAAELGPASNLLTAILDLPEDGSLPDIGEQPAVAAAMQAAEADFARGDYYEAIEGYGRVLAIEPRHYLALLFTGDVYFKMRRPADAIFWFEKAALAEPELETAHRYWGDTLMMSFDYEAAREKYIDALIAEPYNQSPWMAADQWAQAMKADLHVPQLDENAGPAVAWEAYRSVRAKWQAGRFHALFPGEAVYRQTLQEEVEALHAMVPVISDLAARGDAGFVDLVRLSNAGLLEPFVLICRASQDIAQEYPSYRSKSRATLRKFLDEVVMPEVAPLRP